MTTETKLLEYKKIKTFYSENVTYERPYENSWFLVNVTSKDTGEVVLREGYGTVYGPETTRQLKIFRAGNYRFEFSGMFGNVTLAMRVPEEGNIG